MAKKISNTLIQIKRNKKENKAICYNIWCIPQARILARDGGTPSRSATATVSITVIRNLFPPVFNNSDFIQVEITEQETIGAFITTVFAPDADTTVSLKY